MSCHSRRLLLECDAQGPGVRDWLSSLVHGHTKCAAFDTRFKAVVVRLRHGRRFALLLAADRGFTVSSVNYGTAPKDA